MYLYLTNMKNLEINVKRFFDWFLILQIFNWQINQVVILRIKQLKLLLD